MKVIPLISGTVLGLAVVLGAGCAMLPGAHGSPSLKIHLISGDEGSGSAANSVLIEGKKELLLVDAQRTLNNANKAIAEIRATGKRLTTVFITHGHPDHLLGAAAIHEAFPEAQFLATESVARDIERNGDRPASVVVPKAVSGSELAFEKHRFSILENLPGESEASAMLVIAPLKVLIAGDLMSNKVHLFLNDRRFAGWLADLKRLQARSDIETIYPGHGDKAGPALIADNIRYIRKYEAVLGSSRTADEAIARIKAIFPDFKMERFMTYGVNNYFNGKSGAR